MGESRVTEMPTTSRGTSTEYKLLRLYGGAVVTSVPEKFIDASDLRQIPDHQEVYLLRDGDTSIVFEMMELVDKPDREAFRYHFSDMTETSERRLSRPLDIKSTKVASLRNYPAYIGRALVPNRSRDSRGSENDYGDNDQTFILLVMIRLKDHGTDFLISINTPNVKRDALPSEELPEYMAALAALTGPGNDMVGFAERTMQKVLQTLEILNWELFADETELSSSETGEEEEQEEELKN